jgi:acyl-coenzyme A thioesterase PaaI-like protein
LSRTAWTEGADVTRRPSADDSIVTTIDAGERVGFTSELGLTVLAAADGLRGRAAAARELCVPEAGVLRPSVLLTWADILTGSLANEHTLPQVCMTVDLSVRIARPIVAGAEIVGAGRLLKVGRTVTFAETTFTVGADPAPVAVALSTFVASPRPQDVGVSAVRGRAPLTRQAATVASVPVSEMLGTRVVAPGVVEVARRGRLLNWADTVQGGAVAACAEEAVLALEGAPVPTELEVRYTGAVRQGPMRATARPFGAWVRIEVVDTGNDDRLVALAAARA